MPARRLAVLLSAGALVAACSSSGGHHATKSSSAPASPADVADTLSHGIDAITTAQLSVKAALSSENISGNGSAKFASGQITAVDLTGDVPAFGHVRILRTGAQLYAQLPTTFNKSGKPWVLVSTSNSNPLISQFAGIADEVFSAASLDSLVTLVRAAKSITNKGTATVDGTSTTHYSLVVDATKLPASFPGRSDLAGALKDRPTQLFLDDKGRPVEVIRGFVLLGSAVDITIKAKDFNKPVTITAPPAGDVAGG